MFLFSYTLFQFPIVASSAFVGEEPATAAFVNAIPLGCKQEVSTIYKNIVTS